MSAWDDRALNHPALQALRQANEVAAATTASDDPGLLEGEQRATHTLSAVLRLVEETDGELVTQAMLDRVHRPAANVHASLAAYQASRDPAQLNNANAHIDNLLDAVAAWPVMRLSGSPRAVGDAAASYRRATREFLDGMRRTIAELQSSSEGLSESLQRLAEEQAAATAASQRSLASLEAAIESQKARLDQAISTFQQQFSQAEQQRQQAAQELAATEQAEHAELRSKLETGAKATLEDLATQREKAQSLVNVIGAIGFSGGFGAYAKEQRDAADRWRWIAVGSLVALVLVVGAYVFTHAGTILTWESLAERLVIVIPLAALAAYAGTQSARHRTVERYSRRIELELAAIDPYLALFPDSDRNALKAKVADRLFGHPPIDAPNDVDQVGAQQLLGVIDKLVGRIGQG